MSLSTDSNMVMPVTPAYGMGYNNNGGMWGNDWFAWIILLLLFGNRGWGGFGGESSCCAPATCADLQRGFDNQSVMNKLNGLENGLCDGFYAQNTNILNGFHGVDNAVCNLGYQLQDCCCQTQRAIDGVNYNMATQAAGIQNAIQGVRYDMATQACDTRNTIQNSTRDIIDNANANSRAILQALNDNYIRSLENENQSLKLAASQSNQNAVLMAAMDANKAEILRRTGAECPTPAYVVQPPQPVTFPNFCNTCNSCGC